MKREPWPLDPIASEHANQLLEAAWYEEHADTVVTLGRTSSGNMATLEEIRDWALAKLELAGLAMPSGWGLYVEVYDFGRLRFEARRTVTQ